MPSLIFSNLPILFPVAPCSPKAHRHIYTRAHAVIHTLASGQVFFLQFDAVSQDFKVIVMVVESINICSYHYVFHTQNVVEPNILKFTNALGVEVFSYELLWEPTLI